MAGAGVAVTDYVPGNLAWSGAHCSRPSCQRGFKNVPALMTASGAAAPTSAGPPRADQHPGPASPATAAN
jgi:hypothetical protein